MSDAKPTRERAAQVRRDVFLKNPGPALKRAEARGSLVITSNGKVHSVLSVPRDDRPIREE